MQPLSPAAPLRPPRTPERIDDTPLPHRPGCGDAPPSTDTIDLVAERLRSALDAAEALHLGPADLIDLHVCELRQLARWHIVARPDDVPPYFARWTIDDADPVFPVTVAQLRWMIGRLEAVPTPEAGPPRTRLPSPGRTFG